MSLFLAVALGVVVGEVARFGRHRRSAYVGLFAAGVLWQPLMVLAGGMVAGGYRMRRRLARKRLAGEAADRDVAVLGDLTALGLTAGLTLVASMALAATEVAPALRHEVEAVVRRSRLSGAAGVMASADGRAQRLYLLAGRAAATGAPVLAAVQAFVDERRHTDRNAALAAARKLPVRLMFPLALLILPGFVILIVGPTVLSTLTRLGI